MDSNPASRPRWLLPLILFAGLLIRAYHLGHESIWLDEHYSLEVARLGFLDVAKTVTEDVHPPLYHALLYVWIRIFGESEAALRSMSLLFGVFGLLYIHKLGRLLFGATAGLAAAALMAVNVYHVAYSQEARNYSLMALLALASVYYFTKILLSEEGPSRADIVSYFAATFLLLYTHTYGVFTVFSQNLFFFGALALKKEFAVKSWKLWIKVQTALFILYIPWIILAKNQTKFFYKNFWIEPPDLKLLVHSMRSYAGSFKLLAVEALLTAGVLLTALKTRNKRYLFSAVFLSIWAASVFLIPVLISLLWSPMFTPRYAIAASIPLYLLAGAGWREIRGLKLRWAAALVLLALSVYRIIPYFTEPQKEEWRQAAAFVDKHSKPRDLVIFHRETTVFDYYSTNKELIKAAFPKVEYHGRFFWIEESVRVTPERLLELPEILGTQGRIWLVLSHTKDPEGLFLKEMRARYLEVYDQKYLGVEVLLFEKP